MTAVSEFARTSTNGTNGTSSTPPADTFDSDVPSIDTPALARSAPRIKKCRDVRGGTENIRDGGTDYVPQFNGESESGYGARKTIAGFYNAFERTVEAFVGWLVDPPPVLADDMPEALKAMAENVDGAGEHLDVFCTSLLTSGTVDGYDGIFVDHPRADDPRIDRSKASLAATIAAQTGAPLDSSDVKALGLRPYFILVKRDECLPLYEVVSGKRTLVMFIRKEQTSERKGRFGFAPVTHYYVHELRGGAVYYERWTSRDGAARPTRDVDSTLVPKLTTIPWAPLAVGNKIGENEYKPPLIDLADLNISHHRIQTGILSLEELACVVTPVRVGAVPDADGSYPELVLGPQNTIEVPATVGVANPVYYLSPAVTVLEPAMKSLETLKKEMGAMGASFLAPDPQAPETATAHELDASAERASIGRTAKRFKDCLETAFAFAGQYIGETAGQVSVNTEFVKEGFDAAVAGNLLAAIQEGVLEPVDLRHYYKKTGIMAEDFDANDTSGILKQGALRVLAERKALADANANANAGGGGGA